MIINIKAQVLMMIFYGFNPFLGIFIETFKRTKGEGACIGLMEN